LLKYKLIQLYRYTNGNIPPLYPHYTPNILIKKITHTLQKFFNTPMYTTKGYFDTLEMQLNLVPFATNGTYGHDHGWKQF